jgi:SAM-dependent methyltransferase
MSNQKYYITNQRYSDFLDTQKQKDFGKYAYLVNKLLPENGTFLDVGCGTGIALTLINRRSKGVGVDISETSIASCVEKGLFCKLYDGYRLPFVDDYFNIVGSFNVLEHTDDPIHFLDEQFRILSKEGYLIIACPNFLSITNNFHWHTSGLKQKVRNLTSLIKKLLSRNYNFEKMKTIERKEFHPDDDACNVVNPIDILKWSKNNKLSLEDWSTHSVHTNSQFINFIDKTIFKIFFGSCFFVFKKK